MVHDPQGIRLGDEVQTYVPPYIRLMSSPPPISNPPCLILLSIYLPRSRFVAGTELQASGALGECLVRTYVKAEIISYNSIYFVSR